MTRLMCAREFLSVYDTQEEQEEAAEDTEVMDTELTQCVRAKDCIRVQTNAGNLTLCSLVVEEMEVCNH
jgi:hypothetical protein